MAPPGPTFSEKSELVRYVLPVHRQGNRYPSSAAFELSARDLQSPKPYLSVNSTEVSSVGEIAQGYRRDRQGGAGEVALCIHKVARYVEAAKDAGATVSRAAHGYEFPDAGTMTGALQWRPNRPLNLSHSGVEVIRALNEAGKRAFAIRMASKPKYQVL